jgi:uncharacterized repeat protein (TIGR01451 family)
MHRFVRTVSTLAVMWVALGAAGVALAGDDVTVTLTAHKVEREKGREVLRTAETARPGDLIEYHARYRNATGGAVREVAATLPVPAGLEYVAGSATPNTVLASLDGRSFAPVPLTRRVRLADGREVTRAIPASEYRYLRWPLGTLGVRADRTVRARMRVVSEPVAANAR